MKKMVALLLIVAVLLPGLWAVEETEQWEPYREGEFPQWCYSLRRGETLFFGSLALTYPVVLLATASAGRFGVNVPDPYTPEGLAVTAGIACSISLGIVLADYIMGRAE